MLIASDTYCLMQLSDARKSDKFSHLRYPTFTEMLEDGSIATTWSEIDAAAEPLPISHRRLLWWGQQRPRTVDRHGAGPKQPLLGASSDNRAHCVPLLNCCGIVQRTPYLDLIRRLQDISVSALDITMEPKINSSAVVPRYNRAHLITPCPGGLSGFIDCGNHEIR